MTNRRRCAFEGSMFDATLFVPHSGFLVHMDDDHTDAVDPAHEAIEGRLLEKCGQAYQLLVSSDLPGPLSIRFVSERGDG